MDPGGANIETLLLVECRAGTDSLRQIFYAMIDIRMHLEYNPQPGQTILNSTIYKEIVQKCTVMPPLPEDRHTPELLLPSMPV